MNLTNEKKEQFKYKIKENCQNQICLIQKTNLNKQISEKQSFNNKQSQYSQNIMTFRQPRSPTKNNQNNPNTLQQITQTQKQLNNLINQLDHKLKHNYQLKQQKLVESYKEQLIKAHKDLTELKNNTNEQEIKNQMNQKALQLKKQRLELIQINMFYSNKCLQYKKLLDQKLSQGNQLQRQIKFLQNQINNSHKKKIQLMGQFYDNNSPVKSKQINTSKENFKNHIEMSQRYTKQQKPMIQNSQHLYTQIKAKRSVLSTHANTQTMKKLQLNQNSKDKIVKNLQKNIQLNSHVKKLFQDKLNGIKSSEMNQNLETQRKNSSILSRMSTLNKEAKVQNLNSQKSNKQQLQSIKTNQPQHSQIQNLFMKSVNQIQNKKFPRKQIGLFKGQMFSDIEKKQIMKTFLSNQQVKQYIYNIIFDKVDDSVIFKRNKKQKIKILASEKKIYTEDQNQSK